MVQKGHRGVFNSTGSYIIASILELSLWILWIVPILIAFISIVVRFWAKSVEGGRAACCEDATMRQWRAGRSAGTAIGYQSPQFVPRDSIIMPPPPLTSSAGDLPGLLPRHSLSRPQICSYLFRQVRDNLSSIYELQTSQSCLADWWLKLPSVSRPLVLLPANEIVIFFTII